MKKILYIIIVPMAAACKESYVPPVVSSSDSYLVVEGMINSGGDTTRIALSHTFKLDDSAGVTPELNASVQVEGKNGGTYPLPESGNGFYTAPSLSLDPGQRYRLHIRTSAGKEYASDYVEVKPSPPIDSIGWVNNDKGLVIYANTHDPRNASHYYRWEYTETWQFNSVYYSVFRYVPADTTIAARTPNTIYTCWKTHASTTILLGSSLKLAQDLIYEAPLVQIPQNSWEIGIEYSILVKQYVLTPDAYNFWQQLQKNSEQVGSIFSPQPSEARGNIHNLKDSSELVIGYISAGSVQQKRIFIRRDQIPGWQLEFYTDACAQDTVIDNRDSIFVALGSGQNLPIAFTVPRPRDPNLRRYLYAPLVCVDCTQTGSNVKPPFWP